MLINEARIMIAIRLLALAGAMNLMLSVLASSTLAADKSKTGFLNLVHKDAEGKESKYVLFVPRTYKGDKPYPVILFLHGAGERASGKKEPVEVGIGPAIRKRANDFPFLVVIPRAERTWQSGSPDAHRALAILAEVEKEYKVDPKREYLTGLSMGGMGTWSLAIAHPDKWAAIVPICGRGDTKLAARIKDIPCWCFHGDADPAVKVEGSRQMIAALEEAGGTPKYTEYPRVGHNSWDRAYDTKELYEWLQKQHKK
jgi:predicted peptidase